MSKELKTKMKMGKVSHFFLSVLSLIACNVFAATTFITIPNGAEISMTGVSKETFTVNGQSVENSDGKALVAAGDATITVAYPSGKTSGALSCGLVVTNGTVTLDLTAIDAIEVTIRIFMRRANRLNGIVRICSTFNGSSITHHFALQIDLHAGAERHGIFVRAKCLPIDYRASQLVNDVSKLAVDYVFGCELVVDVLEVLFVAADVVAVYAHRCIV